MVVEILIFFTLLSATITNFVVKVANPKTTKGYNKAFKDFIALSAQHRAQMVYFRQSNSIKNIKYSEIRRFCRGMLDQIVLILKLREYKRSNDDSLLVFLKYNYTNIYQTLDDPVKFSQYEELYDTLANNFIAIHQPVV